MAVPERAQPASLLRRSSPMLVLAVGFLLGVLVTIIVVPDRSTSRSAASSTGSRGATSSGSVAAAAGGAAGGPAAGTVVNAGAGPGGASGGGSIAGDQAIAGAADQPADVEPAAQHGVDATTIRLGIGLPDISVIAALGPGYDQGDVKAHVESIFAAWHREGKLPINGRDIVPVYRTYNILSQDEQRAACVGFGQDDNVFGVVAIHDFGIGSECVAAEDRMPLVTADGPYDASYQRGWPFLFTMQMSASRVLRNYIAWGDQTGRFRGKRIGVYYPNDPLIGPEIQSSVIDRLRQLGYTVASVVTTDSQGAATGGPNDSIAVQQFRFNNVDTAILLVSAVAKTNFFNQANAQNYRPAYLENDLGYSTTSTATSTYPADYFDGTVGVTGLRFGESAAGIPIPREAQECDDDFVANGGQHVDRDAREAEYIAANQACDEMRAVYTALQYAGRNLTPERFVAGLETITDAEQGIHGNVTFNSTKHDGVSTYRELLWRKTCKCWIAQGDFKPLASN